MNARHWFRSSLYVGAIAACISIFTTGCGSDDFGDAEFSEAGSVEDVDTLSEPLLTIPGGFYTQAPDYGWCGVAVPSVSGNCHGGYSANSSGGTNTYTRMAAGRYRLTLPGIASGGNAQVTPIGSNVHCSIMTMGSNGSALIVDVGCRDTSGTFVDNRFLMSYYRDTNVGGVLGGYATVRGAANPLLMNVWNSTGGAVSATRSAIGRYRITFPGQVIGADTAQVTAASSVPEYCTLAGWSGVAGGVAVNVRCFDFAGAPADADFSVFYGRNVRGEPRNTLPTGTQGGFSGVFAGGGISAAFSRNTCTSGSNSATFSGSTYSETYHAITAFQGEVPIGTVVTAVATNGTYCNLNVFPVQGVLTDSRAFVKCFNASGQVTTAAHTTMVFLQDAMGPC